MDPHKIESLDPDPYAKMTHKNKRRGFKGAGPNINKRDLTETPSLFQKLIYIVSETFTQNHNEECFQVYFRSKFSITNHRLH